MERDTVSHKAFAANPLFADVKTDTLTPTVVAYRRGEAVRDRLGDTPCVGIVATGLVDVLARDGSSLAVSTLGPGEAFGICNVFAQSPMPTALVCRKAAKVVFLTKEQFTALLEQDRTVLHRYLVLCNEKMQFLAAKVERAASGSCRDKLARYLLEKSDAGGRVPLPHSKEQLARLLGVSRASLFRELAALTREGTVTPGDDAIIVHHPQNLTRKDAL